MIDYNRDVDRSCLDLSTYNAKFDMADDILAKPTLTNPEDKVRFVQMLKDPTLYAYTFFKNDNNNRLRLYDYQDAIINDKHRFIYFRSANQTGKEQPVSAQVVTPSGYRKIGDISKGDFLFGSDGKPCKVLEVMPQGVKPVYKLTFSDGSVAECGYEHHWKVQVPQDRFLSNFSGRWVKNRCAVKGRWTVLRLCDIINKFGCTPTPPNRCIIPVTEPLVFERKELPIDSYIVGVMLGDGTMSSSFCRQITSADEELIDTMKSFLPKGITIKKDKGKYKYSFNSNGKWVWSKLFRQAGLRQCKSEDKSVPEQYLFSSETQRLWLLRGLMDTDGTISDGCVVEFYSKSRHLAEDVRFLVNSLGGKARIVEKKASYKDKLGNKIDCGICFRVRVFLNKVNPFCLSRKATRHRATRYRDERVLRKVEFDRYEESVCIMVDSPDGTYLTNECIVTHNSLLFNVKAARDLLWDFGHSHNEAIVSKSLPQSTFQMRRVKSLLNSVRSMDWKDIKGTTDNMSVISYDIKDKKTGHIKYTNNLICAPCTEGLLGYDLHDLNLDEFEFWETDLEYFFNQIAQPRTYKTKGNIMVMSNPNGQDNFGAQLESQLLKDGSRKWHVYVFNYLDCPGNTQDEYDQYKKELTRQQFESTVAAIRSSSDKAYFTPEEVEASYDKDLTDLKMVGKQSFFFLDVGSKHDQSVLCGGYIDFPNGEDQLVHIYVPIIHVYPVGYPISMVVGAKGDEDVEQGWHYEKSVKEYLDDWKTVSGVPVFGVDITGNSGISPLFNSIGIYPEDVTFSGPVKSGMYQRYKYFMEKRLLHRVRNKDWESQAKKLVMTKSVRGYLMVHHETEDDRDDTQDATAGLIHLASPYTEVQPSLRFF